MKKKNKRLMAMLLGLMMLMNSSCSIFFLNEYIHEDDDYDAYMEYRDTEKASWVAAIALIGIAGSVMWVLPESFIVWGVIFLIA